ncbi:MAG: hypothetical protein H0W65_07075 [Sphingomonas sp.]|uniref:hypothetical protein n=1 Tax=Sphingomonas sp. TaxID=28214 RepID=UPI0017DD685D|nr:hypothetical protein [Sphingomonas sp.]MBA3667466.1 hypothetical protein [Sphingomonas sp.]
MIEHITLAVLIQLAIALPTRSWTAGAAAACAWSISREITQAEYRWIEYYGHGLRANMPWWGGLDQRVWQNLDPWLDWLLPSLIAIIIAFMAKAMRPRSA